MLIKTKFNTLIGKLIGKMGYVAFTFGHTIYVAHGQTKLSDRTINHEAIHVMQQREMLYLAQWLWYILEYLFRLVQYRNHDEAYYNISFEREAYANEKNLKYPFERRRYAWLKYLKK
jgi:hypothetical protein